VNTSDVASFAVLLVEDHPLAAAGATSALSAAGFSVTGCTSAVDGLRTASSQRFDAALVDLDLPDRPGLWLIRQLRSSHPDLRVAALSASTDERAVVDVLAAGAAGYLSKMVDLSTLASKVQLLIGGDEVFDDVAANRLIAALRSRPVRSGRLSPRELEILHLLAGGFDTNAIAAQLFISPHTVRDVIRQVFRKLEVHDRAAAVAAGFRLGLLH
jgi:DNA-binding NarL/FixJ family response regulator